MTNGEIALKREAAECAADENERANRQLRAWQKAHAKQLSEQRTLGVGR